MTGIPPFEEAVLRAICDILGATNGGLTGGEIGQLLHECGIKDPYPESTKRNRLFEALHRRQSECGNGDCVVDFIQKTMNPVRYVSNPQTFESRRSQLNQALVFAGFAVTEDGKLQRTSVASTLSEALERAGELYRELQSRNVHKDVLHFCRAELLQDNYFHAVFEATKSIAEKIREKSGLTSDGSALVDQVFKTDNPILRFNELVTETDRSEHIGFMNLLKGLFGAFRNTTAHVPKIKWVIDKQDAIDILTFISFLHRKLDECTRVENPKT